MKSPWLILAVVLLLAVEATVAKPVQTGAGRLGSPYRCRFGSGCLSLIGSVNPQGPVLVELPTPVHPVQIQNPDPELLEMFLREQVENWEGLSLEISTKD